MVPTTSRPSAGFRTGPSARRLARVGFLGIALAPWIALAPAQAVTIELKDVAPDRVERQRKFVEGSLPLPDTPDLSRLDERLKQFGAKPGAPMLIRIFKADSELEIWMRKGDRFERFATYPICHWSGTLGPKIKEGDKQTPEGFYTVTRRQLHRIGRHPRSLNLGFPNAFDKSFSRTGSYILVHGACSSVGCFAMTNAVIEEIYNLTEASIKEGQEHVPVHVFPFRMTAANLEKHKSSPWIDFWSNLKQGHDAFERTRQAPRITVCNGRYEFQDAAPGEGGLASPLAVCGATAAAIESLEPFFNTAALQPLLWKQALEMLSPSQRESFANRRNLVAPRLAMSRADPQGLPVSPRPIATAAGKTPRNAISTPRCSLERASCRKFVALQGQRVRRIRTARSGR
jgi:murein L,D-transpeptidase YafK